MEMRDQELIARFLDMDARIMDIADRQVRRTDVERLALLLEAALAILKRIEAEGRAAREQMGWLQSRVDRLEDG